MEGGDKGSTERKCNGEANREERGAGSPAGCVCASAHLPSGWVRTGADAGATAGLAPCEGELCPVPGAASPSTLRGGP